MNRIIAMMATVMIGVGIAQSVSSDSLAVMLERAKGYYNSGEYEEAIKELEDALQFLKQLKQVDQVEAYKYLAFSYVAFGDNVKAKEQFKKAIALNPQLELDPASVSPKIIKVFEEARSEMGTSPAPPVKPPISPVKPPSEPPVRSVSKFHATMRSCFVPGWGQMYKGHKAKGTFIMISSGTALGLGIVAAVITEKKHEDYLNAEPWDYDALDRTWKAYNRWHNITGLCFLTLGCVYAYNMFDVLTSRPVTAWSRLDDKSGIGVALEPNAIRIGYQFEF